MGNHPAGLRGNALMNWRIEQLELQVKELQKELKGASAWLRTTLCTLIAGLIGLIAHLLKKD